MGSCSGFEDKIYWRRSTRGFCAFRSAKGGGYRSLCGSAWREKSGGQASRRPEPILRCARCDGLEMERRGWDESGPTLEPLLPGGRK